MKAFNISIKTATERGQSAAAMNEVVRKGSALINESDAHHPDDNIGKLILKSYRNHGASRMKAIIRAYQDGYNFRARELGTDYLEWSQIQKGIRLSLNNATPEEEAGIVAAM